MTVPMAVGSTSVGPHIAPCRSKRRQSYTERLQEILQSLHGLLRAMTVEQRERSFRQLFSQQQRLRLETYIISALKVPKQVEAVASPQRTRPQSVPVNVSKDFKGVAQKHRTSKARVPGLVINPQKNGRYFRAQVTIGTLRLVSRSSLDLKRTLPFCQCLSQIKDRLEEERELPSHEFAETFVKVLHATLQTYGISTEDAGLRLYIYVRPSCTRRRVSRRYDVADEAELRMGLEAWQQMQPGNGHVADCWKQIFIEECSGRPGQLKRACAVLEESRRRTDERLVRRQQNMQRRAEKERQKALRLELAKARKARRQPLLTHPERAVRRLLRRWSALDWTCREV